MKLAASPGWESILDSQGESGGDGSMMYAAMSVKVGS